MSASPLIRVENLRVSFDTSSSPTGTTEVIHGVSFSLHQGEILAVVGESGSGKSVTARSLLGLSGIGARVTADRFELFDEDATKSCERFWRQIRGNRIGLILQDALTALDPLRTIGSEIDEALTAHGPRASRRARVDQVETLLRSVGISDPHLKRRQHSHQLSGGQRQRALIASALAAQPEVLVADEPTTALDVTVQKRILDLLAEKVRDGRSMILVSHDLAVVSSIADRIIVMREGRIVEEGFAREVIDQPKHPYTRALIESIPSRSTKGSLLRGGNAPIRARSSSAPDSPGTMLRVASISKTYRARKSTVRAVGDVSFDLARGQILGVVGESGSGKSTIARIVAGLEDADSGSIEFDGVQLHDRRELLGQIQLIAQDSLGSFDPRYTVREIIAESAALVSDTSREKNVLVEQLLDEVHLPAGTADRHPRTLSGGQRQRVNIARALGSRPKLVVCDEPVSALDVSVQAQILDLIAEIRIAHDTSFLFISHDLGVVHHLCDDVLVLEGGAVVEHGEADTVFTNPRHPYTKQLLDSLPQLV